MATNNNSYCLSKKSHVSHHIIFITQGCGLGLDVSVSRRSRDVPTSRLDQSAQRLGLVSVSDLCVSDLVSVSTQNVSGLVEGLGPFRLVETFHAGALQFYYENQ